MSDENEMTHKEFIRAEFFTPESDMPPAPQPKARRQRRRRDPGLDALARYARALEPLSPSEREAAIFWLADRYLGIKMRRHGF